MRISDERLFLRIDVHGGVVKNVVFSDFRIGAVCVFAIRFFYVGSVKKTFYVNFDGKGLGIFYYFYRKPDIKGYVVSFFEIYGGAGADFVGASEHRFDETRHGIVGNDGTSAGGISAGFIVSAGGIVRIFLACRKYTYAHYEHKHQRKNPYVFFLFHTVLR